MKFSIKQAYNRGRVYVFVIGTMAALPALASPAPEASCPQVAGRVDGIEIASQRLDAVRSDQMSVQRGVAVMAGVSGMPLCYGDIITTSSSVTALLRLDEVADSEKDITLYPNTTTEIIDGSSVFLKLGRLFASLRGRFDVKTVFAILGARGTEFQAEVEGDNLDVIQLTGSLEYLSVSGSESSQKISVPLQEEGYFQGHSFLRAHAPEEMFQGKKKPPAANIQIDRLTHLSTGRGRPLRILGADADLVRKVVDSNSDSVIVTRPQLPSQSLIQTFESRERRAQAYREARLRTILTPERREAFEQLARVFGDWAEAGKALRAYKEAGEVSLQGRELALYYNNLGNAYRLAGDPKSAGELYRKAVSIDPGFAFPYNGMGDMYRDLALAAIDRGQGREATDLLLKAQTVYKKSLDPSLWGKEGGTNRAIPFTHLGQVLMQLGELSVEEDDSPAFAQAQRYFADAGRHFQMALGESPNYPYALVGIGQTYAGEAKLQAVQGRKDLSKQGLARAREHLEGISKRYPDFAVARTALGEVFYAQGDSARAAEQFLTATQLDPGFANAYFQLANVLQKTGRSDEARLYYQSYLRVESPLFKSGTRVKQAESNVGTPLAVVPVPSVVGMNIKDALALIDKSGFGRGTIERRASDQRPDTVIEQSPRGSAEARSGTPVDLVVAVPSGRQVEGKPVKVPKLIGDNVDEAAKKIQRSGLTSRVLEKVTCDPARKVISQDPKKDAMVQPSSLVSITVTGPGSGAVTVPDLRGVDQREALRRLHEVGLADGKISPQESNQEREGTVLSQNPKANTQLARGCPVSLRVAAAVPQIQVPNFIGMTEAQARKQLPSGFVGYLGDFKLGSVNYQDTSAGSGKVISQDPRPGTQVPRRSATPVNLVIARPVETPTAQGKKVREITVPRVTGMHLKDAIIQLNQKGLGYEVAPGGDTDVIVKQDPPAGTTVKQGSKVRLWRGIG
ncbi:MAG: PASTA domain-containing protein [Acidobacteriia bacterium]|nr:PASTA domain-containing protein [Terriglobia bacterium]